MTSYDCNLKCKQFSNIFHKKLWYYDTDGTNRPIKSCLVCGYYLFTDDLKCPCCKKMYKKLKKHSNYKYKTNGYEIETDPKTGNIVRKRTNLRKDTKLYIEQQQQLHISLLNP